MTAPSLALPFDSQYFEYSRHIDDVTIPTSCNVFKPDNDDEFTCRSLIQPAPELGAARWTVNGGKRALIGIFRDEGRATASQPALSMTWTRSGNTLTVTVTGNYLPHFKVDDRVKLYNINVAYRQTTILTSQRAGDTEVFTVRVPVQGDTSGAGAYQALTPVNFYETYVVYRLLPSMRVLPLIEVDELLASFEPVMTTTMYDLLDPITGETVKVSSLPTYTALAANGSSTNPAAVNRQQFAEDQRALQQTYDARGASRSSPHRYTRKQSRIELVEPSRVPTPSAGLNVYDYYGFPLNDATRGPFMADDLVTYDSEAADGLARKEVNDAIAYTGPLFDAFGLPVIGAYSADRLRLRDAIMPLRIDQFNIPFKSPTS